MALDARQQAFKEFEDGAFNVLSLALAYDITDHLCRQVEIDIRTTIPPNAKREMLRYTKTIDIYVSGTQWKRGWWWGKKTIYKHLTADITFNPYRTTLSVWTDPKAPDGIVRFR